MPVTLNSTGISFSDGNSQNTVASGGVSSWTRTTINSGSGTRTPPANSILSIAGVGGGGGGGEGWQSRSGGPGGGAWGVFPKSTIPSWSYSLGAGGNPGRNPTNPSTPLGNPGGNSNAGPLFANGGGGAWALVQPSPSSDGPPGNGGVNPGNVMGIGGIGPEFGSIFGGSGTPTTGQAGKHVIDDLN